MRIIVILYTIILPAAIFAQVPGEHRKQLDSLERIITKNASDTSVAGAYIAMSEFLYIVKPDTLIPINEKAIAIIDKALSKAGNPERTVLLKLKASALNNLAFVFERKDVARAKAYREESLKLSEETGDIVNASVVHNSMGYACFNKGETIEALEHYNKALSLAEKAGIKKDLAITLNNMGLLFKNQGDIPKALEYYHRSLKIREETGDKQGTATSFNNIALVHQMQGDVPKALEYFQKCYKIDEELGDKWGMATTLHNLGRIYYKKGDRTTALEHYSKSLSLREEIQDMPGIANSLQNIGFVYDAENDLVKALDFYMRSLEISEKRQDKADIAGNLNLIGELYYKKGYLQKALDHQERSLKLSRELGFPNYTMNAARSLSRVYRKQGKHERALEMYELYIQMRDSISNEETRKASTKKQLQYDYEKKKLADSLQFAQAQQLKDLQISEQQAQLQQEQTQRYALYGGLLLLVGLAAVSYRSYIRKKRDSDIISLQKLEVERQKELVEEKNRDIVDSINYAQRIQRAMLTSDEYMKEIFPSHFVLFKPKDIVSGDFYWANQSGEKVIWAVADCTGHGVPGAFMSMIGNSFLNEIIVENGITKADQVLNRLREKIINALEQKGSIVKQKDGMDIALCVWDKKSNELEFAGANNPCWIIRNGEIIELKPDKMPIGAYTEALKPFSSSLLKLEKGDSIYTFSDGYADQFGGSKGKKFKYSQLKGLLLSIRTEPMNKQKETLDNMNEAWKGNLEQVDDICVVGVRV